MAFHIFQKLLATHFIKNFGLPYILKPVYIRNCPGASKAVANSGAGDNGEIDADRAMQEQFDAMNTLKQPEGLIKSLEANGIVADINGGWKRCAEHATSKHPNKPLEGSTLVPEKTSEKGKAVEQPPEGTDP